MRDSDNAGVERIISWQAIDTEGKQRMRSRCQHRDLLADVCASRECSIATNLCLGTAGTQITYREPITAPMAEIPAAGFNAIDLC